MSHGRLPRATELAPAYEGSSGRTWVLRSVVAAPPPSAQ